MSPKSFPAAIAVIAVLALSPPTANTLGATALSHPWPRPAPTAAPAAPSLWQRVLAFLNLDGTHADPQPPVSGSGGCEMDPDGVVHVPPPPKTCT
jgi:hypothetical protein